MKLSNLLASKFFEELMLQYSMHW